MKSFYFLAGSPTVSGGFESMGGDLFWAPLFGWEAVVEEGTEDDGLPEEIFKVGNVAQPTFRVAVSDTAASLASAKILIDGAKADAVLLSCEDNDVRIAFDGTTPTQGASGVGHVLAAGKSMVVNGYNNIKEMQFINKTGSSNAVLQVTVEF